MRSAAALLRLLAAAALLALAGGPLVTAQTVQVPFVGCRSDGQLGPQPAPRASRHAPRAPAAMAARLAWYASNELGVLAPRGWHCLGLIGSNGALLLVSPEDHGRRPLDARLHGPAIQLGVSFVDTSGRFEAAKLAARLFPNRRAFVDAVIAEGIAPKSDFPSGPYPHDRVRRIGPDIVAFETPAGQEGVGTMSRLAKSADPIRGRVVMDERNNATLLAVRLSPSMRDLAAFIVDGFGPAARAPSP